MPHHIWNITWFTFLALEAHDFDPPGGAGEGLAHGAALPLRRHHLLAVGQRVALDLVADGDAVVAHADATGLRFPDVVVMVELTVDRAAVAFLLIDTCFRVCAGRLC